MLKNTRQTLAFVAIAAAGMIAGNVFAAMDPLATTTNNADEKGIHFSTGETPDQMAAAAKRGITKYEDVATQGGGGAPQKTLIDNDVVKVNLVAFKKGFMRGGDLKRQYDTLLIYVDPGRFSIMPRAGGPKEPIVQHLLPGSTVFHRKESIVSATRIDDDYRVLFVMMKH